MCWPHEIITFISALSKLTVYLKRSPSIEEHEIPAEIIHCTLPSPQTCVWCHRTARNATRSLTAPQSCGFVLPKLIFVVSHRLKHSQSDFAKLVLQGVGLLDDQCSSLLGFLRGGRSERTGRVLNSWIWCLDHSGEQTCTRKSQSCTVNATSFTPSPCFTKCSPISERRAAFTSSFLHFPE